MSDNEPIQPPHVGQSELTDGLGAQDISTLVNEIMPEVIRLAAATQEGPLYILVSLAKAAGRKEHQATIEKIGHEYLWQHRHEVPWIVQPLPNAMFRRPPGEWPEQKDEL